MDEVSVDVDGVTIDNMVRVDLVVQSGGSLLDCGHGGQIVWGLDGKTVGGERSTFMASLICGTFFDFPPFPFPCFCHALLPFTVNVLLTPTSPPKSHQIAPTIPRPRFFTFGRTLIGCPRQLAPMDSLIPEPWQLGSSGRARRQR
jgi:hypothetical protein